MRPSTLSYGTRSVSRGAGGRWLAPFFALLAMAVLLAAVEPLAAQSNGTVRGVVTSDAARPLAGAQVTIQGTNLRALTNNVGQFVLSNVPAGQHVVRIQMLGYVPADARVTVTAGQTASLNVTLNEAAITLDEVVATGTAGGQQTRALGNVVGRLDASDIQEVSPATEISDMLSAHVPGVRIMATGGEVGAGGVQRIRGVSSISLGGAPLVYVDGVRVSGGNRTEGIGTVAFGGGEPSPLDQIPPENIESIEVIKGPAAATLYGTEASNGVINITTKQGAIGEPRIDLRMRQGAYWLPDPINYFPPTYYRCSGVSQNANVDPSLKCNRGDIVEVRVLDVEQRIHGNDWFRTGMMPAFGADVSGGAGTLRYFFSGDFDREEGYVSYNFRDRMAGRANLTYSPMEKLSFDFNLGAVRSRAQSATPQQAITTAILWACPSPTCEPGSGASSALDGPRRGFIGYLPEIYEDEIEAFQDVDRTTGGITLTHNPFEWFTHRLVVGGDFSNLRDTRLFRATGSIGNTNPAGRRDVGSTRSTYTSADYGASAILKPMESLQLTTSAGAQFYRRVHEAAIGTSTNFPIEVLETLSAGAVRTSDEEFWENRSLGMYFQEELAWQNRFFLTGALRGDDNSAFGENFSFIVYPKVSASWVISEESFLENVDFLSTLRLRGAWGRAGTQPDVFDALRTYEPVTGFEGGSAVIPENVGNPDLKPEVGDEIELGFDAGLFGDRISTEFTYYRQRTLDALVRVPTLPSLGFPGFQFQNLGETKNQGIELALTAQAWQGRDLDVDLNFTLASADNEIVSLGTQNFIVQSVASGQYMVPGYPIGGIFLKRVVSADLVERPQLVGNNPQRNLATNAMCEGGERINGTNFSAGGGAPVPCAQAPLVYWGQPLPIWSGSGSMNVTLFNNLTLYGLVDFIQGRTWLNGDIRSANTSFFNTKAVVEGRDPILLAYIGLGADGRSQTGMMSGDFAKLRTLSAQYRLPQNWSDRIGASRMAVTFAAENVATLWVGQKSLFGTRAIDPERASQGPTDATPGISVSTQEGWPMGRRFTTTLRVSF